MFLFNVLMILSKFNFTIDLIDQIGNHLFSTWDIDRRHCIIWILVNDVEIKIQISWPDLIRNPLSPMHRET